MLASKWMVCEGAATAEASAISPRGFFRRGAALAVQSYKKNSDYKMNADVLFCGAPGQPGQAEYDRGRAVEIELGGPARSKARLVCDPLYEQHRHRYPPNCISIHPDSESVDNNCYDVWDFSRFFETTNAEGTPSSTRIQPGKYLLEVDGIDYHENGVDATLLLSMTRVVASATAQARARKRLRARTASTVQDAYTFDLPLTSCGPSNLILLELDQVKNRLWKPQQVRAGLPQAAPEPEPVDDVRPSVKRQRMVDSLAEELYDVGWDGAGVGSSAKPHQQGADSIAVDSLGTPIPSMSFEAPGRSPTIIGTRVKTASPYGHGGRPKLSGRRPLKSPAPSLRKARVHVPNVIKSYGSANSDSDSDSDCSDIPHSSVNFASFPVGARK